MAEPLAAVLEKTQRKPGDVFGEQVRRHRDRRGWTQRDLCQMIEDRVGATIDPATLARLEKGQRRVSLDEACMLAVVLDVPLMVLMWPFDEAEPVSVAPGVEAAPWRALEWAVGNHPLPEVDNEAWDSATQPLVSFAQLLDAAYDAEFLRPGQDGDRAEYRKALQRLSRALAFAEEVGFVPTEGMIPAEVLADLEEAIARAPKRQQRPIRPRRGEES